MLTQARPPRGTPRGGTVADQFLDRVYADAIADEDRHYDRGDGRCAGCSEPYECPEGWASQRVAQLGRRRNRERTHRAVDQVVEV